MPGSFEGDLRLFFVGKGLGPGTGRLTLGFEIGMASQQLCLQNETASALGSSALQSELVLVDFLTVS